MPIRPENKARYPKDWKTVLVPAVRKRSRNRCECTGQCGLTHHVTRKGQIDVPPHLVIHGVKGRRCRARNGKPHPVTGSTVVLTVAHLEHDDLETRDIGRLRHWCQRCHNRYDAKERRRGVAERRRSTLAVRDLFVSK